MEEAHTLILHEHPVILRNQVGMGFTSIAVRGACWIVCRIRYYAAS